MQPKRKPLKLLESVEEIPEFSTEQEEAEFWQTHSPVTIFDTLPAAGDVKFASVPKRLIPLPLAESLYQRVRREARRRGVSPLTLIQRVVEHRFQNRRRPIKKKA